MAISLAGNTTPFLPAWTRRLLLIGLSFIIGVLVVLVVLPPVVNARDAAIRNALDNNQAFAEAIIDTENSLQQMQATARGYLITQRPIFLDQYRATAIALPAQMAQLADIGAQVDQTLLVQLDDLRTAIADWEQQGSARQIALTEEGYGQKAADELAIGDSQEQFDAIRSRIRDLTSQVKSSQSVLLTRLRRVRTFQMHTTLALGVLGLIALGYMMVVFWRMSNLMRDLTAERGRTTMLTDQLREQLSTAERQNHQLTVFHAVASASAISLQPAQRTSLVLNTIARTLGLPATGVWIVPSLATSSFVNERTKPCMGNDTLITQVLERNEPSWLHETDQSNSALALLSTALESTVRSAIILPLRGRDQPIGALVLASTVADHFVADDRGFYHTLAAEVGLVLDNARLHAEVQAERQRLLAIFDHSPAGILVAEVADGRIVLANPIARSLTGELSLGTNVYAHPLAGRVFRPGNQPVPDHELPLVPTLCDGAETRGSELIITAPDGTPVPVLATSIPLHNEEGILTGGVVVFQDLRQLREVERLKSDFVALVSHELRTPLTAIKGCTETLLRGTNAVVSIRVREFLQIIDEQSDRLQELIDNLLSLSQVEAGALRLRRTLVDVPPLIYSVLRQARERMEGLHVQADVPQSMPLISADPRRLEQVLFNVLDNARIWSPSGSNITVMVQMDGNAVRFTVRDQGPGIPVSARERVFERFFQVGHPPESRIGGSGLGLTICKALVEAHGGQIGVGEASGGGAEVWFTIPAVPGAEVPGIVGHQEGLVHRSGGTLHVLVIDDDPALRRMLDRSLSDAGYAVQTAIEAQSALDAIATNPPDLILLDLMLPGIDGFDLCQQLREWTNVPIIMLTARASEQDIVRGIQLGADDYLTKPFYMSELLVRMEAVLRRAQPPIPSGGVSRIQIGDLIIDLAQHQVTVSGIDAGLTPTEYSILVYLAQHAGQVLTHTQLLKAVWGDSYGEENNYLWVHIAHLRRKIEADPKQPQYILTERGVGYRLAKG